MVKVRVRTLKESVRDSLLREYIEMDELEASRFIASKASSDIAADDIVDEETGEIYIEKGKPYGSSILHPDEAGRAEEYRAKRFSDLDAEDDDGDFDPYDDGSNPQAELEALIRDFASTWEDSGILDDLGSSASDIAHDAAESFFWQNQDWKKLADAVGINKGDLYGWVADEVYSALSG